MYERFTDRSRAVFHSAFGRRGVFGTRLLRRDPRPEAPESAVVAALLDGQGVAWAVFDSLGITAVESSRPVGRDLLAAEAVEVGRRCGVNYVGTEHILIALAQQSGSALPALGVTPATVEEWLAPRREPSRWAENLGRRLGKWLLRVTRWAGRRPS